MKIKLESLLKEVIITYIVSKVTDFKAKAENLQTPEYKARLMTNAVHIWSNHLNYPRNFQIDGWFLYQNFTKYSHTVHICLLPVSYFLS